VTEIVKIIKKNAAGNEYDDDIHNDVEPDEPLGTLDDF
jgi:hypothetical protein